MENNLIIEENRKMQGIIAAIIGALIGCAAWVLVGYMGYIAAPVAFLIYFLAAGAYKKFGRREDVFGYVFSGILVFVMVTLGTYISTALLIHKEFNEMGRNLSIGRVFNNMGWYMRNYDLWGDFIKDLVIGYVFSAVAVVSMLVSHIKESKNKENIK